MHITGAGLSLIQAWVVAEGRFSPTSLPLIELQDRVFLALGGVQRKLVEGRRLTRADKRILESSMKAWGQAWDWGTAHPVGDCHE
ncbi:hypothetical protein [Sphingobium sp. EM0848]|uniref:hypothetical protein n=1 Tax=Sphingobium sp. EM0848 TaxID=2743473 RepID=UPI00159CB763|nr:hypothetical protein [Sphingobium sp. EM0848]